MTAVIAWLALGVSVISLGWQITSWLWGGARLKVTGDIGVTYSPVGITSQFFCVRATNRGRAPATITGVGFALPNGKFLMTPDSHLRNVTLPAKVEPEGGDFDYWFDPEELRRRCAENACTVAELRAFVRSGKTIKGKWSDVAKGSTLLAADRHDR